MLCRGFFVVVVVVVLAVVWSVVEEEEREKKIAKCHTALMTDAVGSRLTISIVYVSYGNRKKVAG